MTAHFCHGSFPVGERVDGGVHKVGLGELETVPVEGDALGIFDVFDLDHSAELLFNLHFLSHADDLHKLFLFILVNLGRALFSLGLFGGIFDLLQVVLDL